MLPGQFARYGSPSHREKCGSCGSAQRADGCEGCQRAEKQQNLDQWRDREGDRAQRIFELQQEIAAEHGFDSPSEFIRQGE